MKNKTIIGLSGYAGSGKDLFCKILCRKGPEFVRKSLADNLKADLRDVILKEDNIDILNCSREEKDSVRPKLVEYAKAKRESTDGRYWLSLLNEEISSEDSSVCVTDIRYDDYEFDEVFWLRKELDGVLVHIERYDIINNNKKFLEAPNKEERRNEPKLRNKATYNLQWQTFSGSIEQIELEAGAYVDEFLAWLDGYNETFKGQSASVESEGPKV
jgi:hypothetical protein